MTKALCAEWQNAIYETADNPVPLDVNLLEIWWARALEQGPGTLLVVDEIQKMTGWSEVLKRLWDGATVRPKVVVTGSSSVLIEKGLKETMAGRFEMIRAGHWTFAEANAAFKLPLHRYIEFGCYPGSMRLAHDTLRWAEYIRDAIIEPVIGRDILQLHPVENPALLRQVFGMAAAMPAQIVSLHKIMGQLQHKGSIPTIQHYLNLLSQAFLVTPVPKYSASALRARNSPPKLIIHDNALMRCLERPVNAPLEPERVGRYFENAVGARYIEAGWDVFYWTDRQWEVDFVVIGPDDQHYAIEVKSARAENKEMAGAHRFCKLHPEFKPCLVSLCGQTIAGTMGLDVQEILSLERK